MAAQDRTISLYRCGPMVDLCTGPHLPNTGYLKAASVHAMSRANWRGDVTREPLQVCTAVQGLSDVSAGGACYQEGSYCGRFWSPSRAQTLPACGMQANELANLKQRVPDCLCAKAWNVADRAKRYFCMGQPQHCIKTRGMSMHLILTRPPACSQRVHSVTIPDKDQLKDSQWRVEEAKRRNLLALCQDRVRVSGLVHEHACTDTPAGALAARVRRDLP